MHGPVVRKGSPCNFALQAGPTPGGDPQHNCRYSVISREVVYMSLRSLFSSLRYRRSQYEYLDGAGLIIAARLKDLLASDNGQLHTVAQPTPDVCASENKHPVEIDTKNSTSSAVKTAA